MKTDARVDQYIGKAPPFAQPILSEFRQRVQKACPAAAETIKWNVPFFLLDGKLLASMAGFKKHVKVGVWTDGKPAFVDVTTVAELPSAQDHAGRLQAAAKQIASAAPVGKSAPKKASKAPAKKAASPQAKKAASPPKRASAKKASAKKASAAKRR